MKILLIDDDSLFRLTAKTFLSKMGHEIIVAKNGLFGIHLALTNTPDLILSDYRMPGMNGKEIFLKLKANPKTQEIPFVIISGDFSNLEITKLLAMGVFDVLEKPIDFAALQNRIVNQYSNFILDGKN